MKHPKEPFKFINRSFLKGKPRKLQLGMAGILISSLVVGGTLITHAFSPNMQAKQDVISTVTPQYEMYPTSLQTTLPSVTQSVEDSSSAVKTTQSNLLQTYSQTETQDQVQSTKKTMMSSISRVSDNTTATKSTVTADHPPVQGSFYNANIPMPRAVQSYLYKEVTARGLDLKKTLALIMNESNFNPNKISATHDYGYFQINIVNHQMLASTLGTPNEPLNPYVNIKWGTYMLSQLYHQFSHQGLSGQALDDAVWSSYNKGVGGYAQTGEAVDYVHGVMSDEQIINGWF